MRRAARLIGLILILVPTVLADVSALITRAECWDWESRPLAVRKVTAESLRTLDAITLSVERMPGWVYGVALPGISIIEEGGPALWWAHEQAHQIQMREDGAGRYAATYASDWLRGRYAGCGAHDAYRSVGYEREARMMEWHILDVLWGVTDRQRAGGTEPSTVELRNRAT